MKYAAVYGPQTQIVPFTFTCMLSGASYRPYQQLHLSMRQYGGPIHIHVLSGSCHYVHRFMTLFPEHRARVVSQVYDSPCNADGIAPTLARVFELPLPIGNAVAQTLFADCFETSKRWVQGCPFHSAIPSGFISSIHDTIAPTSAITTMIHNWNCADSLTLVTDSRHLESIRDYPERYKAFCLQILDRADLDGWKIDSIAR